MKKTNVLAAMSLVSAVLLQSALPVFAADSLGGKRLVNEVGHMQTQASREAQVQQNELQSIINRADTLIANRLTSLNTLSTRVQNDSKLSASEKSSLSSDIQSDITGLTALKTKIDGDTDVTTARTDTKQIITGYYIYALFEPKMRLLIVLNNLQAITANLQLLVPQIQNLINTLQSQGKDVSQLTPLLSDVSSQLQTINTTLTTDITSVQNITTSSGISGAEKSFAQVRQDIAQVVRSGFAKIRSDFAQMRPLFHQLILPNKSKSPTQTISQPTASPTPTP